MIYRTHDATLLNAVANKPEVKSSFCYRINSFAPLDFSEMCSRAEDYIVLTNGSTAFGIFDRHSPTVWDGHSIYDTSLRGRGALLVAQEFIDWMWSNTQALIITGKIPLENKKSRLFHKWLGFTSDGVSTFESTTGPWTAEWLHLSRPLDTPDK